MKEETFTWDKITEFRHGFYSTVLVFMTRACPLRCRHCAVDAGPDHNECISQDVLRSWMKGLQEVGTVKMMGVSGGEPFIRLDILSELVERACAFGIQPVVVTSAFWATTPELARITLQKIPHLEVLQISADEFHEEFVSAENIKNASTVALDMGIKVIIGLTNGQHSNDYYSRFSAKMGRALLQKVEVFLNELNPKGRAAKNSLVSSELTHELPDGFCSVLGAPILKYDGSIMACCQDRFLEMAGHHLWIGNMYQESFKEIYKKADKSILLQTLRTIGPKGIIEIAVQNGWDWKPRRYRKGDICDLCRDIVFSPYLVSMLESYAKDDETFMNELTISRFLRYGEVMPV